MRRLVVASAAASVIAASSTRCVVAIGDPSCGGSGGLTIVISPRVVYVAVGESLTPKATWCRDGRYDTVSPQWSLSSTADANIISLDASSGRVTGKRAGQATVVATYSGAEGSSMQVTVR